MKDILIVIDMQNDFINGTLGTKEAAAIVENTARKIADFHGSVFYTQDTHDETYLQTQEGRMLPVAHCVKNTSGWELAGPIKALAGDHVYEKNAFASFELAESLKEMNAAEPLNSVTLVGLCTDICVISNALLLKAVLSETALYVDASCCAGTTPEKHRSALAVMKSCQITVINEE